MILLTKNQVKIYKQKKVLRTFIRKSDKKEEINNSKNEKKPTKNYEDDVLFFPISFFFLARLGKLAKHCQRLILTSAF